MKTFFISLKIWAKTVFLNACLLGLGAVYSKEPEVFDTLLVLLIGGFLITAPLLLFIEKLVRLSLRMPYGINARIALLFFSLVILIMFFYLFMVWLFGDHLEIKGILSLTGVTSVALLIAVLTTRKSLIKINTPQNELIK